MRTIPVPFRAEIAWDFSDEIFPAIELTVENCSEQPVRMEIGWSYAVSDQAVPWIQDIEGKHREFRNDYGGCLIWNGELIDQVAPGSSKRFFLFDDYLRELVAASQVLSTDLHWLWVQVDGERYHLMSGQDLSQWIETYVLPKMSFL